VGCLWGFECWASGCAGEVGVMRVRGWVGWALIGFFGLWLGGWEEGWGDVFLVVMWGCHVG